MEKTRDKKFNFIYFFMCRIKVENFGQKKRENFKETQKIGLSIVVCHCSNGGCFFDAVFLVLLLLATTLANKGPFHKPQKRRL